MFELPADTKHRDRVRWLLSKWETNSTRKQEENAGEQGMVRLGGREISVEGGAGEGDHRSGVDPITEGKLEKMEVKGDKDNTVEEGGEEESGDLVKMSVEGVGGSPVEGNKEGSGGQRKKRRYRQVLDWGTVKYKEHRYKYDPCKFYAPCVISFNGSSFVDIHFPLRFLATIVIMVYIIYTVRGQTGFFITVVVHIKLQSLNHHIIGL